MNAISKLFTDLLMHHMSELWLLSIGPFGLVQACF